MKEGRAICGSVNTVTRIGDTVRRPVGHWTALVHELLRYLERAGFEHAPRVHGIDAENREILSYIQGTTAKRPWPAVLSGDQGVAVLARFLKNYHLAVQGFIPSDGANWRDPNKAWRPGMIVKHGDLGPWNTVWQGTELAGVIDWDFAEPGEGLEDAAQMAWYSIPLRSRSQCRRCGFETIPDLRTRLRLFCEAYGTTPDALIASLLEVQENEMERIRRYGEQSIPPWDSFHDRGDVAEIKKEQAWLIKNQRLLI